MNQQKMQILNQQTDLTTMNQQKRQTMDLAKMQIMAIVLLCLSLYGCGGDGSPDASLTPTSTPTPTDCTGISALGSWSDTHISDTLTLRSDCSGSDTYCAEKFVFSRPSGNSGSTTLIVTSTNRSGGCLGVGSHNCGFIVTSNQLAVSCGVDGTFNYSR